MKLTDEELAELERLETFLFMPWAMDTDGIDQPGGPDNELGCAWLLDSRGHPILGWPVRWQWGEALRRISVALPRLISEVRELRAEVIETLVSYVRQECSVSDTRHTHEYDSCASRSRADAMLRLAELGVFEITHHKGRRVLGKFKGADIQPPPKIAPATACKKCGGSGWLWGHELAAPPAVVTDCLYTCDECDKETK